LLFQTQTDVGDRKYKIESVMCRTFVVRDFDLKCWNVFGKAVMTLCRHVFVFHELDPWNRILKKLVLILAIRKFLAFCAT
jgi:hypothetical protein